MQRWKIPSSCEITYPDVCSIECAKYMRHIPLFLKIFFYNRNPFICWWGWLQVCFIHFHLHSVLVMLLVMYHVFVKLFFKGSKGWKVRSFRSSLKRVKVFSNRPSKICGRQLLKNWKSMVSFKLSSNNLIIIGQGKIPMLIPP